MRTLIFTILSVIFLSACQNNGKDQSEKPQQKNEYFQFGDEYVHMIPDSLRTEEQQALYDTIKNVLPRIIGENVVIENNHLVFKMSKEEFAKTGLPIQYYDLILKDMENNNNYLDTAKIEQSVEEIWKNSPYAKYRK